MARSIVGRQSLLVLTAFLVAACSVINAYDDVVPTNAGAGTSGNGAVGNQGGGPDMQGGAGNSTSMGAATSMGGVAGGNGGEGGVAEPGAPTTGLVVLGGKSTDGTSDLLLTLDPKTGAQASRETIPGAAVVGVAYDGAPSKNLWFVFTASEFPAPHMSKADLQVRSYDDGAKSWTTLKKVSALPPPRPNSFVLLNDRLAYLSFGVVAGALTDTLTILDTSDPTSVKQVTFDAMLGGSVLGLVGTRGAPGDATALGGTLAIATGNGCSGAADTLKCTSLSLTPIFVGDDITTGVVKDLRGFMGQPAFASAATSQRAFVALPAATANGNIDVIRFDPRDLMFEAPLAAPTTSKQLAGLSFNDCLDVTVFSSLVDTTLWATTAQGTSAKAVLLHAAQDVVYEPFTSSIVAPFNPENPLFPDTGAGGAGPDAELAAFTVAKAGVATTIKPRAADWKPPTDVAINVVAARLPIPFKCP